MKTGWRTSEFWLAAHWSATGAWAVSSLIALSTSSWPAALCALPSVCVYVWMAGIIGNNYAENRFQLKAREMPPPAEAAGGPARVFGFGRYVASEPDSEDEEDEE